MRILTAIVGLAAVVGTTSVARGQTGACCLLDGTCFLAGGQNPCNASDGAYQGDGTSCSEIVCPEVFVFYDDADAWLAATKGAELRAFDECYPSLAGGSCTVPGWPNPALVTLGLAGGNIEVTVTEGNLVCPLDAPSGFQVSDLIVPGNPIARAFVEFDPSVTAFFTYYNNTSNLTAMEVYDDFGTLISQASKDLLPLRPEASR